MNFYLARNDDVYLVNVLLDGSLQVELRDSITITFSPQTWRVMDYGWLITWSGWETHLKAATARNLAGT
jgi:hypothetical protein